MTITNDQPQYDGNDNGNDNQVNRNGIDVDNTICTVMRTMPIIVFYGQRISPQGCVTH